ncbi:MAG: type IV pilus modification protein PilV [Thiobacillaceae bacterium]|jgi:type IV pilus assembly protein PilV|nr:type IV pilus modification protein PilV [Thiobacillaceae bacterium]
MRRQSGFSMLEVLVAILVLAIGLLGMAGLTATSMRNSHGAYHRSQAVWLAYDAADRMRANRQVALAGGYNLALGSAAPGGAAVNAVDLGQWLTAVGALPQGLGAIAVDGASRQVTITVQWNESRAAGGAVTAEDATRQFVVETQL